MKKLVLLCLSMVVLFSSCYKDDIDDLNDKYNKLKTEQERQAEQLRTYNTLLQALQQKLTVDRIDAVDGGYEIVFSNGSKLKVNHGKDGDNGIDGIDAPYITSVVEVGGTVIFYMSDGTQVTIRKTETLQLYVLSEGGMGANNSELALYDIASSTVYKKYYGTQNDGAKLGDTGNDLKIYGSNMYCVVSGPDVSTGGYLEIIDPATGKSKKRIPITDMDGDPDMPRRIAFHKNKAYVTLYSGAVARIDTASLTVDATTALSGTYPEGICVSNNSLYIANSGQGTGNTISVIDIARFEEAETITVPKNPTMIASTSTGDIYFTTADLSWSSGEPSNLHLLNPQTKTVTKTFDVRASKLAIGKDYVYTVDTDWDTYETVAKKINLKTKAVSDFITDGTFFYMGYNINYNPVNGNVFMTEMGQTVYCFNPDGELQYKFKTGVTNSTEVVFVNTVN